MGSLADIAIPTEEVEVAKGVTITVRGLSFLDVSTIFRDHAAVLDKLYREHVIERHEMPPADQLAKALMTEAPDVVAHIIARANDEPELFEKVSKLPGITQVNALLAVARLTFHSEDEVKKLLETVIQGAGVLSNLLGIAKGPRVSRKSEGVHVEYQGQRQLAPGPRPPPGPPVSPRHDDGRSVPRYPKDQ